MSCTGASGSGKLRLVFRADPRSGRTVLAEQLAEAPFCVQRALHYDMGCPGMAHVYIASISGGILQGDAHSIRITVGAGALAHVTTQGATRIYGMDSGAAEQDIVVTLGEDSYMEMVPDQIIPYGGSRFRQRTILSVHDSATLICSEIVTPGRVAMGESFEYNLCHLETRAYNHERVLRLVDIARIEPGKQRLASNGVLGDRAVAGSVYVLTAPSRSVRLHAAINDLISESAEISGGASVIRGNAGLLVRVLADRTEPARDAILKIAASVRKECVGAPFLGIRKC